MEMKVSLIRVLGMLVLFTALVCSLRGFAQPTEDQALPGTETPALTPDLESEVDEPEVNVLASARGTKVVFASSQYDDVTWAARNLIDGAVGEARGYASNSNKPQDVVFELPRTAMISQLLINPWTTEDKGTWANEGELWGSESSPHRGFTKIVDFNLRNTPVEGEGPESARLEQSFSFGPTYVRWVSLRLKSNHGSAYIELGEVSLIGSLAAGEPIEDDLANVVSAQGGGKLVSFNTQYDNGPWAARNLIDGALGPGHGYSSSPKSASAAEMVVEIVFELPETVEITQVAFNPFTSEQSSNWAKDVELLVSTASAKEGFSSVGKFELNNLENYGGKLPPPDQMFDIDPVRAKFVTLRLLSNHGGGYVQMGEFKLFARKAQ